MRMLFIGSAAMLAAAAMIATPSFAGSPVDKGIFGNFDTGKIAKDAFVLGHITGDSKLLTIAAALGVAPVCGCADCLNTKNDDMVAVTGGAGLDQNCALPIDQQAAYDNDGLPAIIIDNYADKYDVAFLKSRAWDDGSAKYPATGQFGYVWNAAIANAYGIDIGKHKGAGHSPSFQLANAFKINKIGANKLGVGAARTPLDFLTS